MRYLTRPAIDAAIPANTLIELTHDDPAATAPDEGVLAAVVDSCEELVDGYLRGRHDLPFENVPSIVRSLALDLVRHALYLRRPEGAVPETIKSSYANAIKLLETIRDGRITIGNQDGKPTPEPGKIRVRARKQQFAGNEWEGWQ